MTTYNSPEDEAIRASYVAIETAQEALKYDIDEMDVHEAIGILTEHQTGNQPYELPAETIEDVQDLLFGDEE